MAVTVLLIPNDYPKGYDETQRSIYLEGQALPYDSGNALVNITAFSITSNVVTFTAKNALTTGGGQAILVAGFQGAFSYLNGGYTTTSATSTTIVCSLTHADVASTTTNGLATLSPNYSTGGLAIGALTTTSGVAKVVAGIGPSAATAPKKIDFFTLKGSAQNYKMNMQTAPPQMLDFTGITQATGAAAIPADSIGFKGEWVKGAF